jgi:uncharacterized ferredoxin-like protein
MKEVTDLSLKLMAASARAVPKTGERDFIEIVVITKNDDLKKIAAAMNGYASKRTNEAFWVRDASHIEHSQTLLLISHAKIRDCGIRLRRLPTSEVRRIRKNRQVKEKEMVYAGLHCVMRIIDRGVALSSVAKTAIILNVDNRLQQWLGLIKGEIVMGILGISGKGIYYARQVSSEH